MPWPILWLRINKHKAYVKVGQNLVLEQHIWYYNLLFLGKVYTIGTVNYDKAKYRRTRIYK